MMYNQLKLHLLLPILLPFSFIGQRARAPKLIVSIVVDQMCYDYLYRFENKFSNKGFKKLMQQGVNCRNTRYNYVPTLTGPGHASIYTGTTPSNHGIVANDWFDRVAGKRVNCVEDTVCHAVGSPLSKEGQCSPRRLKTTTVTDQLKLTYPKSKVISLSIKDRGAILPGGHLSDGSYWFDSKTGKFITSSFYKNELPGWLIEFNQENRPALALNSVWSTLFDLSTYTESNDDHSPYEQLLPNKSTPTFPYDLSQIQKNAADYSLFTFTPFANTALTDLAIRGIEAEKLGVDNQVDMLCISYSTPDIVGHAFGPYSVEMEDTYLRLDRDLGKLIGFLEQKLGKKQFIVVLTADHAVAPVPQQLVECKLPGGYFITQDNLLKLRKKVLGHFGFDPMVELVNGNIYVNHGLITQRQISVLEISKFIRDEVSQWMGVKAAYTSAELTGSSSGDIWFEMIRNGFDKGASGDVIFILESGFLAKNHDTPEAHKGTSHGSVFNYDTHVPLLWYGNGIKSQEIERRIDITDIAATLTNLLKLQRTGSMSGEPIWEIRK